MAKPTWTASGPDQDRAEEKIKQLRELYADAPELGRVALENGLPALKQELAAATGAQRAGRIGRSLGQGLGAHRDPIRSRKGGEAAPRPAPALEGNFQGADAVGRVHDTRFVLLDNDTKLLFATAYDGE